MLNIDELRIAAKFMCQEIGIDDDFEIFYNDSNSIAVGQYIHAERHIILTTTNGNRTVRSKSQIIETLFHEIYHYYQFETGKLRTRDGKIFWQNKKYKLPEKYSDRPWEIEANAMGKLYAKKYLNAESFSHTHAG